MQDQQQEVSLQDYLRVLRKRKGIIIFCALIIPLGVYIWCCISTPIYESSITIWVEKSQPTFSFFNPEYGTLPGVVTSQLQTQCEILKSRSILSKVIQRIPNLYDEMFKDIKDINKLEALKVNKLRKNILVKTIRGTELIEVKVCDPLPERAQKIANILGELLVELNLKFRRNEAKNLYEFTASQLKKAKERLSKAESALKNYKEKTGIALLSEEARANIEKIVRLESMLAEVETNKGAMVAKLKEIKSRLAQQCGRIVFSTDSIKNPKVVKLKKRLEREEIRLSSLKNNLGVNHSKIKEQEQIIEALKDELNQEIATLFGQRISAIAPSIPDIAKPTHQQLLMSLVSLETELCSIEAKEKGLRKLLQKESKKLSDLPKKELTLARLTRDAEVGEKIYTLLLKKNEEARIAEAIEVGNIHIVDPASKPLSPIKPKKKLNTLIGAVLGLFLGIGLAFLREHFDVSIKSVEDVEEIVGIPVIGFIPNIKE
jgi:polysaccharide chain length determinant protein (PEP-CTERM system associated)